MDKKMREAFEHYRIGNVDPYCTWGGWQAACKWQRESMQADGWRQCAKGQRTSQFCGQLEAAVAAERAVSDRLLEALTEISEGEARASYFKDKSVCPHNKYEHENCEACLMEFADMVIAEVEALRKGKPE